MILCARNTVPRGGKHRTDFADEAARIREVASRGGGLDPNQSVLNMSITRKQALKRIDGVIGENSTAGIEAHIGKLTRRGSGPHIRAELNARIGEIERLIPHVGKKAGDELAAKVAEWRRRIAELADVDY